MYGGGARARQHYEEDSDLEADEDSKPPFPSAKLEQGEWSQLLLGLRREISANGHN